MNMIRVPQGAVRNRKRLGRGIGSGLGKTSGKGHNGQNARSGGGVRPGFEGGQMPLYRRIARRGFSNYRFKIEYEPINLDVLCAAFEAGSVVDLDALKNRRMVSRNVQYVKILGRGECSLALTIQGLAVSAAAKTKIEAAGGTVTAPAAGANVEG
ncbi:MAG: 50S ribosomal protein L15 [Spirochaetaceae bacterium]|nr:MAG: 50S ribosomal protein L15 [Spirochaetaceae bacterium]